MRGELVRPANPRHPTRSCQVQREGHRLLKRQDPCEAKASVRTVPQVGVANKRGRVAFERARNQDYLMDTTRVLACTGRSRLLARMHEANWSCQATYVPVRARAWAPRRPIG